MTHSTARERAAASRALGKLGEAHADLGLLFDQGKLPRDMRTAQALDALKRATGDLVEAVEKMTGRA
jgi:hypothetical protein